MLKYNREQVKAMSGKEYEYAMCKELNDAGFKSEFHGEYYEYKPSEDTFGGNIVFDANAVSFLKQIGLINNGKCPMCSIREDEQQFLLRNQRSGATYHVCKTCYKRYASQEQAKRGCACCLGLFVIIAIIIWSIIKLFF